MPSPFPGMDPWLEGDLWTTIHSQLAAEIARQLSPQVLPKYFALTTQRQVLDDMDDVEIVESSDVFPDVGVIERSPGTVRTQPSWQGESPVQLQTVMPRRVPHFAVEIRDVKKRRLVTAIEILSPSNKRGTGREGYLRKRRRLLQSDTHLVEIDLLRKGRRVPMRKPLPHASYFVLVSRSNRRPLCDVWPIQLSDRLPTIAVPLLPRDGDASLDLQAALTTIYDVLGYRYVVDYARPPDVPLTPEEQEWTDARIRDAEA